MKKYLFFLVATALFAACDDDVTRDPSPVTPENCMDVYFTADNVAAVTLSPEDTEFTVKASRTNFAEEANVPIRVSTIAPECFVFPEAIHFAAGQEDAELRIGITDQIKPFVEYQLSITVDEAYADYYTERPFGSAVYAVKAMQSDWKPFAKGIITCTLLFKQPFAQDMEYSAILDQYRFPEAWAEGEHFVFTWDGGDTFKPIGPDNQGLVQYYIGDYEPGAPMYFLCAPECPYIEETKTFHIMANWYVVNYGNQGRQDTTVEIVEFL